MPHTMPETLTTTQDRTGDCGASLDRAALLTRFWTVRPRTVSLGGDWRDPDLSRIEAAAQVIVENRRARNEVAA